MTDFAGQTVQGEVAFGSLGREVAAAGDINGDGIVDYIVTAPSADIFDPVAQEDYDGAAYVVFGDGDGPATLNVVDLDGSNGFRITSVGATDASGNYSAEFYDLGTFAAGLGDVNGDGIDDIIVGGRTARYYYTGPDSRPNFLYVVFGKDTATDGAFDASVSVAALDGTNGFAIDGVDGIVTGIEGADINGDGLGDILISQSPVPNQNFGYGGGYYEVAQALLQPGGTYSGFAIFGEGNLGGVGNGDGTISVLDLDGSNGFGVLSERSEIGGGYFGEGGFFGTYGGGLTNLGDVNGDGFDDLLIRNVIGQPVIDAPYDTDFRTETYVLLGRDGVGPNAFPDVIDPVNDPTVQQVFWNPVEFDFNFNDRQYYTVAGVGDVNGDGFDDVAISQSNLESVDSDGDGTTDFVFNTGPVHVLFGGPNGVDTNGLSGDSDGLPLVVAPQGPEEAGAGFTIFNSDPDVGFDRFGQEIAGVGDINGDGIADLAIGAPFADLPNGVGGSDSDVGEVFLVFGRDTDGGDPAFDRFIDIAALSQSEFDDFGYKFTGIEEFSETGLAIAGLGDVNNDGIADFAVGAARADAGDFLTNAGQAYVVFGGLAALEAADNADGTDDNVIDLANLDVDVVTGLAPIDVGFAAPNAFQIAEEGDSGVTTLQFALERNGDLDLGVSVDFTVTGSGFDPAEGSDFIGGALPTGTVVFAAGSGVALVEVDVAADVEIEGDEDFRVDLSNALVSGAGVLPVIEIVGGTTFGRIDNDDIAPIIRVEGGGSVFEGTGPGTTTITFDIVRDGIGATAGQAEVVFDLNPFPSAGDFLAADSGDIAGVTIDGTPVAGSGFLPLFGQSVVFEDGEDRKTVSIDVIRDGIIEPRESLELRITQVTATNGVIYDIDPAARTATIRNDDGRPADPPPGVEADVFGDPHIVTLDGLGYDFQAVGEYILVETLPGDPDPFQVQVRFEPLPGSDLVSVTTRMAVEIAGQAVEIDALGADALLIGGSVATIDPTVGSLDLDGDGNPDVFFDGDAYTLILNDAGEQLQVKVNAGSLNVCVFLADPALVPGGHAGAVRGLMGNANGDLSDDLTTRDGVQLAQPFDFAELYGPYAESWHLDSSAADLTPLFSGPAVARDTSFPVAVITVDDLPPEILAAARQAAIEAGLDPAEPAIFDAAVLDFALTGNDAFLEGALGLAATPLAEVDPDPTTAPALPASFGITPARQSIVEGSGGGTTSVAFSVFRAGDTSDAADVTVLIGGDLVASDLISGQAFAQTVSFAAGETSRIVTVGVQRDGLVEADEALTVTIDGVSSAGSFLIAGPSATTLILNDDAAPVANDDTATTALDTPVTIAVLANDVDANNDLLSVAQVNGQAIAVGGPVDVANGTVAVTGEGDLIFTPDAGFLGTETFTYTIDDGVGNTSASAEVSVEVIDGNTPPDAIVDSATTDEDVAVAIDVLANDVDADGDTVLLESFGQGAAGSVVRDDNGTPGDLSDDLLVYTPDAGATGTDTFEYTISDGNGGSDTAVVSILVEADPGLPVITGTDDKDKIKGTGAAEIILGLGDKDKLEGKGGDDQIFGGDEKDDLKGGDGDDLLHGGDGDDKLKGEDGDDALFGGGGDDKLEGKDGDDELFGGDGEDDLKGGDGDDLLHGGDDDDKLKGEDGDDALFGGGSDDKLEGKDGDDELFGGDGDDELKGGDGDDLLHGGDGDDELKGEKGDDVIYGGDGDDELEGKDGEDILVGGLGKDELKGGKDADIFVFAAADAVQSRKDADIVEDFEDGEDLIGLTGGLGFGDLTISEHGKDAVIQIAATGEFLAVVEKAADDLDASDFTTL